jgi:hypothetical protein
MWPDKTANLKGHNTLEQVVSMNVDVCIKYLTTTTYPIKILNGPSIKAKMDLLWKFRGDKAPVDLFDKITWDIKYYTPLQHTMHPMTTIHLP